MKADENRADLEVVASDRTGRVEQGIETIFHGCENGPTQNWHVKLPVSNLVRGRW